MCVGACGGQKMTLNPLELGFQAVVTLMWVLEPNTALLKEQKVIFNWGAISIAALQSFCYVSF